MKKFKIQSTYKKTFKKIYYLKCLLNFSQYSIYLKTHGILALTNLRKNIENFLSENFFNYVLFVLSIVFFYIFFTFQSRIVISKNIQNELEEN